MENIAKFIGPITKVGERICDDCGSIVPILERTNREGKKEEHSVCLKCDTQKLKESLPKQEDLPANRIANWIKHHEHVEDGIKSASFSSYKPKTDSQLEAKRLSMGYVKKFGNFEKNHSILFLGDVGVGKSHLSYSVTKELKQKGCHVLFIPAPNLMNAIKSTYQSNSKESQEQFMSFIAELDLLVLDDIGAEYVKQDPNGFESWAADVLFQITNIRQTKPTIYTTNYTSEDMEQKYGRQSKRILSRMLTRAQAIKIEGEDYRIGGIM